MLHVSRKTHQTQAPCPKVIGFLVKLMKSGVLSQYIFTFYSMTLNESVTTLMVF